MKTRKAIHSKVKKEFISLTKTQLQSVIGGNTVIEVKDWDMDLITNL